MIRVNNGSISMAEDHLLGRKLLLQFFGLSNLSRVDECWWGRSCSSSSSSSIVTDDPNAVDWWMKTALILGLKRAGSNCMVDGNLLGSTLFGELHAILSKVVMDVT